MNVLSSRVVLRERDLSEVLDLSLRFVATVGGKRYVQLWLLSALPAFLVSAGLRARDVDWVWVWALAFALFYFVQVPFTLAASRWLFGDDASLASVLRMSARALPRQVLMRVSAGVLLCGATPTIVLLPWAMIRLLHLPEVTLLEGTGVFRAYGRCRRITHARATAAFNASIALLGLVVACVFAAEFVGQALWEELLALPAPGDSLLDGGSWFALVGLFLAAPFISTARFLAYIDGRTRREAWDVQLRFSRLASENERSTK